MIGMPELRWVRVPVVVKSILFGVSAAGAWAAGAMSDVTFWEVFLGGEAGIWAGTALRAKVWERLRSKPWAVRVFQAALFLSVFAFAAVTLVALVMAIVDALLPGSPAPPGFATVAELRPPLVAATFLAVTTITVALWGNRGEKLRLLDELAAAAALTVNLLVEIDEAADAEEARAIARQALTNLVTPMLRPHGFLRVSQRSLRTALVFVPACDGRFDLVFMYPEHYQYNQLPVFLRPAQWRPAEVALLHEELLDVRKRLKGRALKEAEDHIKKRREACASITGYAYKFPGLHVYPDVTEEFFRTEEYLEAFAPQDRLDLAFRSKAAIRLQCGSRVLGVLVLTDTAPAGFMNADKSPIEMLAPLLALVLDRMSRKSAIQETLAS